MATILTQVRLATTANVVLATNLTIGVSKIDNVIVATNDRILVKAQSNAVENGIYTLNSSGVWARASDWAATSIQTASTAVFVQEGNTFADTGWVVSTDGAITVGTTATIWKRFSLNLTLSSADLPSSIILRKEKGYPLTNDELDNNFKYLSTSLTEKLDTALFTGANISTALGLLTPQDANLNSWLLRDKSPAEGATASTVAVRTSSGDLYANIFYGNLSGNSTTSTSSIYATTAGNISGNGIVALVNGGTGSNSPSAARTSLGAVNIAGDTLTGKLVFAAATTERASLRITPSSITISAPVSGDIWVNDDNLLFRTSGATRTVAFTDSPAFTGSPTVPTADITSNGVAIASTAYVQLHRSVIDTAIALKANTASPALTGTPTAPTAAISDNSTRIATTAYTVAKLTDVLTAYSTTIAMNSAISSALTSYSTTSAMNSAISSALTSYYTKAQIDNTFAGYSTTIGMNTAITNAVSPKADTTYVNNSIASAVAPKANTASPALTGTPTAPTAAISDNSTRIATTAYTVAKIDDKLTSYSTTSAMNSAISSALTSYSSTSATTSAINSALTNYYTKAQIDTTFAGYSTTSTMNLAITNAVSSRTTYSYVDSLQHLWGTSRKFVQSGTPSSPQNGDFWFKI
jgi:hypothetical protein